MNLIPNQTYVTVHENKYLDTKKESQCRGLFVGFGVVDGKTGAVVMFKTLVGKRAADGRGAYVLRCYDLSIIEVV